MIASRGTNVPTRFSEHVFRTGCGRRQDYLNAYVKKDHIVINILYRAIAVVGSPILAQSVLERGTGTSATRGKL